jgi:hypothetical protein
MDDEPDLGQYEREPTRVRTSSGKPWLGVWSVVAVAVISFGVAGTVIAPHPADRFAPPVAEAVAAPAETPAVSEPPSPSSSKRIVTAPPLDVTSGASGYAATFEWQRRRSTPLVVESTDFHANSGAAYYGIGGKLIRALAPVPTRTPNPGDAPD